MSANGSRVFGLVWWVGVLWTEPVGLVVADLLPIPKPPPEKTNSNAGENTGMNVDTQETP